MYTKERKKTGKPVTDAIRKKTNKQQKQQQQQKARCSKYSNTTQTLKSGGKGLKRKSW